MRHTRKRCHASSSSIEDARIHFGTSSPFLMVHTNFTRLSAILSLVVLSLSACTASLTGQENFRAHAETYIRANINNISTRSPVVGGKFHVEKIEWIDDDTARVSFEDGHIALRGTVDVRVEDNNTVVLTRLRLENKNDDDNDDEDEEDREDEEGEEDEDEKDDHDSSASASMSVRAKAGLGEFCGGIAAFQCEEDLTCRFDGTYPDAGGVCVDDD